MRRHLYLRMVRRSKFFRVEQQKSGYFRISTDECVCGKRRHRYRLSDVCHVSGSQLTRSSRFTHPNANLHPVQPKLLDYGETAPYCLLLRPESPCRLGQLHC
jgi:hypothetical protein